MKQLIKKLFGWMKESNRPAHMKAGNTIFVIVLIVFTLLGGILLNPLLEGYSYEGSSRLFILAMIQALIVVFIAMCSVEYIQERMGCKWDWLDIAAGCLGSVCITVFTILLVILA
ncbi:hypothetical protein [Bacteroides difficilis]|jgi:small neutral amino acid transporter SnatA (MarC family)|uniref:Uncharacterized protein n=1 Tax=Bacteroides difficilis TaxID=2763021 RepID=A0ABR7CEK0_9BACE|nr:hypothetical protein [Bacteroides difficilis]MBC5606196.1 hypothetical protein [Bacteroides difficilis]